MVPALMNDASQRGSQAPESSSIDAELVDDINRLIAVGLQHQQSIVWPDHVVPHDVEDMLCRFSPSLGRSSWLSDDNINQVLAHLVRDHGDATFVRARRFANAYSNGEYNFLPTAPASDLVLIPVCTADHWFLISIHGRERQVVVHNSATLHAPGFFVLRCVQVGWNEPRWTLNFRESGKMVACL